MIVLLVIILDWFNMIIYSLQSFMQFLQNFFKSITTIDTNSSLVTGFTQQNQRYENIISLTFYYAWHVITRKIDVNYPDVQKKVLNSTRVIKAIEKVSRDEYHTITGSKKKFVSNSSLAKGNYHLASGQVNYHNDDLIKNKNEYQQLVQKNHHRAFEHLMRLRSCISSSLLRIAGWILYRLLSRMFTSVQFSKVQIEQIRNGTQNKNQKEKILENSNSDIGQNSDVPILYLPLHRSYLDCILITFILSMNGLSPPLVACDDDLLLPFLGNLMRGLGAFFVKQSNSEVNDDKNRKDQNGDDPIYQAILQSYIIENLRQGNSIEFFLEGMRTCTGKVMMPKLDLLSMVLDALAEGSIQQVCVVPVSISYEKSIEGSSLMNEQMNEQCKHKRTKETFILVLRAIWSTLRNNYGTVRVDFGKPFMLNEYVNQILAQQQIQKQLQEKNEYCEQISENISEKTIDEMAGNDFNHDCVACAYRPSKFDLQNSTKLSNSCTLASDSRKNPIELIMKIDDDEQRFRCLDSLAKHVLYDAYRDSAIMCTHLVSFILINKYKTKGTTIDQLAQDLDWLRQTICRDKQQNISVIGDSHSLIRQAMQFLGEELIVTEKVRLKWSSWNNKWSNGPLSSYVSHNVINGGVYQNRNYHHYWDSPNDEDSSKSGSRIEIVYLKPANKLPALLHLQYYSNYCSSSFIFESVLATSLYSFINQIEISSLIYDPSTFVSNLSINKKEFIERCKRICSILQNEFIFTKSCQSLDQMLKKTFEESFVKRDIFVLNPNKPTGLTLPMSDVNHFQAQNSSPSSIRNRWLLLLPSNYQRRRWNYLFKLEGGSLQNECILEVDEDGLEEKLNEDEEGNNTSKSRSSTKKNQPQEFYIRLTEKNAQLLSLYRSILEPYMQAYWLVADRLATAPTAVNVATTKTAKTINGADHNNDDNKNNNHKQQYHFEIQNSQQQQERMAISEEKSFLKNMVKVSQKMAHDGSIHYECTSMQMFKNALKYFGSIGAVKRRKYPNDDNEKYENFNHMKQTSTLSLLLNNDNNASLSNSSSSSSSTSTTFKYLYDKQQMLALAESIKNFCKIQQQ